MPVNDALLHGPFYGNFYVRLIGAVGFAYLMGSIAFGPLFAWLFAGLDERLRSLASGLAPAFNVVKAFIPVVIAAHGGGSLIGLCAAAAAIAGHCYCPWLRWQGGDGGDVQLGVLAALCWPAALAFAALWLAAAISSNYAAVGTLAATIFTIVSLWFFVGVAGAIYGVVVMLAIAFRHREHFLRFEQGIEPSMRAPQRIELSIVRLNGQPVESF